MSTSLTQLAGDVASFYNLTQDEAYTKLKSVFTGETESLKDLGVVMTQTALDSFAMAEGCGKTTKAMTEQEKVALRFAFVTKQLNAASGDFIRTQDSWANQIRILSLNFDSFKANIGQALINIFTPFLKIINQIIAKLADLSSVFVKFSEIIFGTSISGGGGSPPTDALEDVAGGYENVEKAATGAKKAQDKYLSGLDEIKTFTESSDSGAAAVSGGGGIDLSNIEESKNEIKDAETPINALVERVKELVNLFKEGFAEGLGDVEYRLQSLKDSVESIKNSFAYIFDDKLADGFNTSLERVIRSLGVIAGSVTSIGVTIATNLVGGFSKYLTDNKEKIKQYLLDMFDIRASIYESLAEGSSAFAYIFEEFSSEAGQGITANLVEIFVNSFMEISQLAAQLGADILDVIVSPVKDSKEELRAALGELLAGYEEFTASIKDILNDSFGFVNEIYNSVVAPVFETLKKELSNFYKANIAPLAKSLGEFYSSIGDNLSSLWNKLLKPLINWIVKNILPAITPVLEGIVKRVMNLFSMMSGIAQGLIEVLGGIISFLVGVFTLDWQRAWEGIKGIFKGIFNALASIVGNFVNSVIDAINGLIGGVNSISSNLGIPAIPTIPEFKIPKLATGAVIPPNAPFMAILGDQKHGTNIEAPLDTIKQAVREVVGTGGGGQYQFTAQINRRILFEEMIEEAKLRQSITGRSPFDLA